ncbi:MAG: hypothetical protein JWO82_910 [Akkermansiaceae bacterium]|nr:hypothetical protein [Akkermansiaceae bacterium]
MKKLLLSALFLAAPLLNSCKDTFNSLSIATTAITDFHTRYNSEDYSGIYDNADPVFQTASSREDLSTLLTGAHTKLGKITSTDRTSFNTQTYNGRTTVEIVDRSEFEHGNATERFNYKISGGKATLSGYHIELPPIPKAP